MSVNENPIRNEGATLAAEYALGVLSADERREAERRIGHDSAFAADVEAWQETLAPLTEGLESEAPPASVWGRIQAMIRAEKAAAGSLNAESLIRLRRKMAFWRGLAFGSLGLAAASLAGFLLILPGSGPSAPVAQRFALQGGPAGIVATFDPRGQSLLVVPAAPSATEQLVPELWLLPPNGTPRSLGVVIPGRPTTVALPNDLGAQVGRQPIVAISLEPPGGSPTGAPTGPVIARGTLRRL